MSTDAMRRLTDDKVLFIRRNFADMRNQDIADAVGVSKSTVSKVQREYNLRKSPEQRLEMLTKAGKASAEARGDRHPEITPEVIAKRVASYKRTFREELIRVKWGLEQRTKIRVRKEPKGKRRQRSYLKSLGYILDEANCVAYYTPETTRAVRMERDWSRTFHQYYKFKPYEKDEHQREPDLLAVAGE